MLRKLSKREKLKEHEMARRKVVLWYTAVKELPKNMRKIAVEESVNGKDRKKDCRGGVSESYRGVDGREGI